MLSLVGWVGGGGSVVATGQEKVTAYIGEWEGNKVDHVLYFHGYYAYLIPVSIEMTGAACVKLFKSPLLPIE